MALVAEGFEAKRPAAAERRTRDAAAPATLPVAERFVSINGEGPRAGQLAAFVRFAGCNLSCSWCDTAWAIPATCPHEDVTVPDLVEWVAGTGAACVTLTGGEPALQPALPALVGALAVSDAWGAGAAERVVEIETNGSVDLGVLDALRRCSADGLCCGATPIGQGSASQGGAEFAGRGSGRQGTAAPRREGAAPCRIAFTLDCKMPSSGMDGRMLAGNRALLGPGDAVKFVVASHEDLACAASVIEREALSKRCEVFLSPVFGCIDPADIASFMRERALAGVRLQLQLHKIIWPDQEKGV